MQETTTHALVLDIVQTGEHDARVTLYTEAAGKLVARAKSLYKPQSKLAAHLQPLTIAHVRLVEKKGMQIVDALALRRYGDVDKGATATVELLATLKLLTELTTAHQPDRELWGLIAGGKLVSSSLLKALGFDPEHARCDRCHGERPSHFLLRDTVYLCRDCFVIARVPGGLVV